MDKIIVYVAMDAYTNVHNELIIKVNHYGLNRHARRSDIVKWYRASMADFCIQVQIWYQHIDTKLVYDSLYSWAMGGMLVEQWDLSSKNYEKQCMHLWESSQVKRMIEDARKHSTPV